MSELISCVQLSKWFEKLDHKINVIEDIYFTLNQGESVAIVGQSGTGKSTLLQILGGLMSPSQGQVRLKTQNLFEMSDEVRSRLRNQEIGFVFQFHHLLPDFSAIENVSMPMWIRRDFSDSVEKRAQNLLESVGLSHRLNHKPSELSGGEQQRVSIARALIGNPSLIIADEPTGNLDTVTARKVADVLFDLVRKENCGLIIATHSFELAQKANRVLTISDGKIHAS